MVEFLEIWRKNIDYSLLPHVHISLPEISFPLWLWLNLPSMKKKRKEREKEERDGGKKDSRKINILRLWAAGFCLSFLKKFFWLVFYRHLYFLLQKMRLRATLPLHLCQNIWLSISIDFVFFSFHRHHSPLTQFLASSFLFMVSAKWPLTERLLLLSFCYLCQVFFGNTHIFK